MQSDHTLVITTTDNEKEAEFLARSLLEARLAACVQIVPVRSLYRWEGRIEEAAEWRLEIKTRADLYPRIEALLKAQHGYDTPEILRLPIAGGSAEYRAWIDASTGE